MASGFGELGMEIIKLGQENQELRQDLPFHMLKALFEFVFVVVAQQFYQDLKQSDIQAALEQSVDLFLHGAKV